MNKKTMILSVVIVFATTLLLSALMFTTNAAPAGNPRATGGGTTEELGEKSTFVFNAIQKNDGTVNGHLVYHFRGGDKVSIKMNIDCLTVTGNNAIISGVISQVNGNVPPFIFVGQRAEFQVVDNGEGEDESPDLISDLIIGPNANCGTAAPAPYLPVDGNIQVQP